MDWTKIIISLITTISSIGFIGYKISKSNKQTQKSGDNSINIQAGKNLNIRGNINDK